jgi:hypothetical protein
MSTRRFSRRWARIAGLVLVAIPLSILVLFTYGETTGGSLYGLQHLVEAVPLAIMAVVAWRWPRIGGPLLAGISALLGAMFVVATRGQVLPGVAVGTALVFFAPPLLAGSLFWAAAQHDAAGRGGNPA